MITTISYQNPLDTSITHTATVTTLVNVGQPGQYVSRSYNDLTDKPTLGTASARNVASSGDASSSEAVLGNDSRLTNSRVALPHNHAISDVTGLQGALDSKYNIPTGDTSQYVTGNGTLATFPTAGQAGTLVRQIRNETGTTLTKGTVVYITGASGNKPTVSRAIATSDDTSAQTFGVVQEDIITNQNGYVVVRGDIAGINTSAFPEGSQLYLSGSVAGSYTVTKPVAPLHLVYVGIVTRQHATQGQIEVAIQNGYEIEELHDVLITSKQNNDIVVYEQSTNLWKNKTVISALGYTPVRNLVTTGIPYIKAPSGTIATNGVVTLGTALPTTYDMGAWVYFPAGAVVSGLAGLYWTVFSSTTVGQVYTNFIDSSVQFNPTTRPSGTLTNAVGSNAAFTGVTGAVNMIHFDIPAGTVNDNSQLVINEEFSYNLTAGSKQAGRFAGGATLAVSTRTSTGGHESATSRLRFRGLKNNAWYYSSSEHNFTGSAAYVKISVDHANAVTYRWTLNTAVATDHMVIEALSIIIEG